MPTVLKLALFSQYCTADTLLKSSVACAVGLPLGKSPAHLGPPCSPRLF